MVSLLTKAATKAYSTRKGQPNGNKSFCELISHCYDDVWVMCESWKGVL